MGLMMNMQILQASADSLQKMLSCYNKPGRKNSTKTHKIRTLMALDVVKQTVPADTLEKIEKACVAMDEQRKKRSSRQAHNDDVDDCDDEADEAGVLGCKACPEWLECCL